jgi:hypothetical protein
METWYYRCLRFGDITVQKQDRRIRSSLYLFIFCDIAYHICLYSHYTCLLLLLTFAFYYIYRKRIVEVRVIDESRLSLGSIQLPFQRVPATFFPGGGEQSGRSVKLTTYFPLLPRLRITVDVPLTPSFRS